jgi:hypothetical protein
MAIESKAKRWSMMNFASPIHHHPLFEPDGAIDADDRSVMNNLYGGIALDNPSGDTAVADYIIRVRRRRSQHG